MKVFYQKNKICKYILGGLFLAFLFLLIKPVQALELPNKYPRIGNVFYSDNISATDLEKLARYDVIVIGLELQYSRPDIFSVLREYNPDIIILAYVASEEIQDRYAVIVDNNHPHYKLYAGIPDSWFLKDSQGDNVIFWSGTKMLNVTSDCPENDSSSWHKYLADFMSNEVISTGYWDGIFYDNVWNDISWLQNDIDADLDGLADSTVSLDSAWQTGMESLFRFTRENIGDEYYVVGNGGGAYYSYNNGNFVEGFEDGIGQYTWTERIKSYQEFSNNSKDPSLIIVNAMGEGNDYQKLRYTIASTLLDDGFVSYDYAIDNHVQLWWFDEYNVALGEPTSEAYDTLNNNSSFLQPGVWRRDFTEGIVIVNSTDQTRYVRLGGPFEKITGFQDPAVNNGEVVTAVSLEPDDGIVLMKRLSEVEGVTFENGAYAKVWDNQGREIRNSFYSYDSNYPGGVQVVHYDINNDGQQETVMADYTHVWVYDYQDKLQYTYCPYTCSYDRGINIAVGDLDKDGYAEIVTGTELGGGPHIRIFDHTGKLKHAGFFAFASHFRGGAQVAIADLDGDGWLEIVVGAGYGGGPHVRVFDRFGKLINPGFFAYDSHFRGGVNIAVGDLDNDGSYEIVTGAGPGGGPHVRIFDKDGKLLSGGFFAYDSSYRSGVRVQVVDIDCNGVKDILTMTQIL